MMQEVLEEMKSEVVNMDWSVDGKLYSLSLFLGFRSISFKFVL